MLFLGEGLQTIQRLLQCLQELEATTVRVRFGNVGDLLCQSLFHQFGNFLGFLSKIGLVEILLIEILQLLDLGIRDFLFQLHDRIRVLIVLLQGIQGRTIIEIVARLFEADLVALVELGNDTKHCHLVPPIRTTVEGIDQTFDGGALMVGIVELNAVHDLHFHIMQRVLEQHIVLALHDFQQMGLRVIDLEHGKARVQGLDHLLHAQGDLGFRLPRADIGQLSTVLIQLGIANAFFQMVDDGPFPVGILLCPLCQNSLLGGIQGGRICHLNIQLCFFDHAQLIKQPLVLWQGHDQIVGMPRRIHVDIPDGDCIGIEWRHEMDIKVLFPTYDMLIQFFPKLIRLIVAIELHLRIPEDFLKKVFVEQVCGCRRFNDGRLDFVFDILFLIRQVLIQVTCRPLNVGFAFKKIERLLDLLVEYGEIHIKFGKHQDSKVAHARVKPFDILDKEKRLQNVLGKLRWHTSFGLEDIALNIALQGRL